MKTIVMTHSVTEEDSFYPLVNISAEEATTYAKARGARLPMDKEYDRIAQKVWIPLWEITSDMENKKRVLRGGGWASFAGRVRAAYRYVRDPSNRNDDVGFRLAKDIPDDEKIPDGWMEI